MDLEVIPLTNHEIEEATELSDRVIKKIKYGVIRIVGENYLREVKYSTYKYLKSLPPNFKGLIELKELNLTVSANQIVKLEEREKEETEFKNFAKLPTETIFLDKDFNFIKGLRVNIEKNYDEYYMATCHYAVVNGEKQYYVDFNKIKYLNLLKKDGDDPDYPHYIAKSYRYGEDIWEIKKRQEENKKRK